MSSRIFYHQQQQQGNKPATSSIMQPKVSSQQYSHLTVREIKHLSTQYDIDYYTPIQQHLQPLTKTADKITTILGTQELRQEMIYSLVKQVRTRDSQYIRLKQMIKQQLQQKSLNLSQMQSRRKTFSIDCFRQVLSYPFKREFSRHNSQQNHQKYSHWHNDKYHQQQQQQLMIMGYNFIPFWRRCLDRQLRRVLWQKSLINQYNKQQFFTYDHQLTPYNIQQQFRLTIQRIAQKQAIKLKQIQKDMAIKMLQYVVKKTSTLPNRSQVYMCLNIVELFSYYNMARVNEIGAVYCGLENLAMYYYEQDMSVRISRVLKVIEYVDIITFTYLNDYFFTNPKRSQQSTIQLNQIYQHFRMSLMSRYLPLSSCQYLIDQLLIKKRTVIDMYVMFGIVILVLGDHIQRLLEVNNQPTANAVGLLSESALVNKNNIIGGLNMGKGNNNGNSSGINNINMSNSINMSNINLLNNNTNANQSTTNKQLNTSPQQQSILLNTNQLTSITLKQIFQSSKQIIKLQQIVESFNVVFEKIPASFSQSHKLEQTNKLFEYMLEVESGKGEKGKVGNDQGNKKKSINKGQNNAQKIVDQQQQLMRELQQLKQQQHLHTNHTQFTLQNNYQNNYGGFLTIKGNKANYQRLGHRK